MKKILSVFVLTAVIGLTSCAKKKYTCPTYMKDTQEQKDMKVKNTFEKTSKAIKARG